MEGVNEWDERKTIIKGLEKMKMIRDRYGPFDRTKRKKDVKIIIQRVDPIVRKERVWNIITIAAGYDFECFRNMEISKTYRDKTYDLTFFTNAKGMRTLFTKMKSWIIYRVEDEGEAVALLYPQVHMRISEEFDPNESALDKVLLMKFFGVQFVNNKPLSEWYSELGHEPKCITCQTDDHSTRSVDCPRFVLRLAMFLFEADIPEEYVSDERIKKGIAMRLRRAVDLPEPNSA